MSASLTAAYIRADATTPSTSTSSSKTSSTRDSASAEKHTAVDSASIKSTSTSNSSTHLLKSMFRRKSDNSNYERLAGEAEKKRAEQRQRYNQTISSEAAATYMMFR